MTTDRNPLSEGQRLQIQQVHRGRELRFGSWRNFCCRCGIPMVNHVAEKRYATDLVCVYCSLPAEKRQTP